jgi:Ca2+-binding EF-hand superfamily protein
LRRLFLSFTDFIQNRSNINDLDLSNPTTTIDVFIEKESIHRIFSSMGAQLSILDCKTILQLCNQKIQSSYSFSSSTASSTNDKISFATFLGILSEYIPSLSRMEQLKEVWSMLDEDNDGRIPLYKLRQALIAILNDKNDPEPTERSVDMMITECWPTAYSQVDRLITFHEFVEFMQT